MLFSQGIFVFIYLTFLQAVIFLETQLYCHLEQEPLPSSFLSSHSPSLPSFYKQLVTSQFPNQGPGPWQGKHQVLTTGLPGNFSHSNLRMEKTTIQFFSKLELNDRQANWTEFLTPRHSFVAFIDKFGLSQLLQVFVCCQIQFYFDFSNSQRAFKDYRLNKFVRLNNDEEMIACEKETFDSF